MPRQARLDSPGTLHHVMIRGIEGRNIVDDDRDRQDFVRRLSEVAVGSGTTVFAWALMSNHAHILLASGVMGLAKFMRRLLTGYAVATICATAVMAIYFRTVTDRSSVTATAISPNWSVTFISIP